MLYLYMSWFTVISCEAVRRCLGLRVGIQTDIDGYLCLGIVPWVSCQPQLVFPLVLFALFFSLLLPDSIAALVYVRGCKSMDMEYGICTVGGGAVVCKWSAGWVGCMWDREVVRKVIQYVRTGM